MARAMSVAARSGSGRRRTYRLEERPANSVAAALLDAAVANHRERLLVIHWVRALPMRLHCSARQVYRYAPEYSISKINSESIVLYYIRVSTCTRTLYGYMSPHSFVARTQATSEQVNR